MVQVRGRTVQLDRQEPRKQGRAPDHRAGQCEEMLGRQSHCEYDQKRCTSDKRLRPKVDVIVTSGGGEPCWWRIGALG